MLLPTPGKTVLAILQAVIIGAGAELTIGSIYGETHFFATLLIYDAEEGKKALKKIANEAPVKVADLNGDSWKWEDLIFVPCCESSEKEKE